MGINKTRKMLYERDGGVCQMCEVEVVLAESDTDVENLDTLATVGHIVPRAFGGTRRHDNIQLECHKCNTEKSSTWEGEIAEGVYINVSHEGMSRT